MDLSFEEVLALHDVKPPTALPSNRRAWEAFLLVSNVRRVGMSLGGPAWSDVRAVLDLYGLWSVEVHRKLDLCFSELIRAEADKRSAAAAAKKTGGRNRGR